MLTHLYLWSRFFFCGCRTLSRGRIPDAVSPTWFRGHHANHERLGQSVGPCIKCGIPGQPSWGSGMVNGRNGRPFNCTIIGDLIRRSLFWQRLWLQGHNILQRTPVPTVGICRWRRSAPHLNISVLPLAHYLQMHHMQKVPPQLLPTSRTPPVHHCPAERRQYQSRSKASRTAESNQDPTNKRFFTHRSFTPYHGTPQHFHAIHR